MDMILELFTWTPDKQTLLDGLVAYNFAHYDELNNFVTDPEVQISHIGPITKTISHDDEGFPVTKTVTGHHANLRCFGNLAKWFIEGKEQHDEEGNLKSIFERTKILDIIQNLEFKPFGEVQSDVPAGYVGPNGVLLIDPAVVATPHNIWA